MLHTPYFRSMAPMKAIKDGVKAMSKGAIVKELAEKHEMRTAQLSVVLESLAVKESGVFSIPPQARHKVATESGKANSCETIEKF